MLRVPTVDESLIAPRTSVVSDRDVALYGMGAVGALLCDCVRERGSCVFV